MAVQDLGDTDGWTATPVDHDPFADGSDSVGDQHRGFSGHIAATSDPEHPLTARSLPFAAGQQASISPFTPSPSQRLQQGVSEAAQSYGVPVQGAERMGVVAPFAAAATPIAGQVLSGAEMVHSAQQRDPVGTIAGGLGALPSLSMLIGPAALTWSKAAQKEAEDMLAAGVHPDEIHAATRLFQNPLGQWQKEIPDTAAYYTEQKGPTTLGKALYLPEAYDAYPGLKDIPLKYWPKGQEGGLRGSFWADRQGRGSVMTPSGEMALRQNLGSPSVPLHETGHAIQTIEGWPMGGTPKRPYESNPNYQMWENFQRKNLEKLMTDPPKNSAEFSHFMGYEDPSGGDLEFPDFQGALRMSQRVGKPVPKLVDFANRRSNYDYYRSHFGEAEARNIQNRWLDAKVEGGYGALEPFYKTFDTNYFSYPQYAEGGRVGFQDGGAAHATARLITASGTHEFQVEIAADDASRAQGLKGRSSLPADRGMVFLFEDEAPRSFNMRDVRIPLDIIFISAQGRVTRIARAAPQAKHPIPSGRASMAVLELKGGTAARIGLKVGDRVEAGGRAGFQAGGGLEPVEGNPFGEVAPGVTAGLSAREVPDRTIQPSDLARAKGFPEPRSPMHDRIAEASRDDIPYTPEDIDQPGPMTETLAHYASNPEHAMPMRVGAAIGEEAKRMGQGLWSEATAPGDVLTGKTTMEDPETQQRVIGLAASLPGGGAEEALGARGPVSSAAKAARVRALRKQAPEETTTYEPPWSGAPAATTTEKAAPPGAGSNAPRTVWNPTTGKWEGAKPTASLPEGVTYPPLFNFDPKVMNAVPDVPQFPLQRYDPPKGVSARMRDLVTNPDVRRQMIDIVKNGMNTVGLSWYNTGQLRAMFLKELGDTEGQQAFEKYMNLVSATSPENKIPQNIRTASYFYEREAHGEPPPERGDPIAQPYGSKAQKLHQQNVGNVLTEGYDVLKNPKPPSFVQNLMGNYEPGTMDRHAFKLPAILSQDPRFLETSFTPEKGAEPVRPQKMFQSGKLTMEDAVKQPTMWAGMPNKNEYKALEGWYKSIADELGITPAQVQASAWVGGGHITGLASPSNETFLHSFQGRVFNTAYNTGLTPAEVIRRFIRGEQPLLAGGPGTPPLLQQEDQDRARKEAQTSTAGAAAPPPQPTDRELREHPFY